MRKIEISASDAGMRLDRFLQRMLPEAGKGFLYRMLRKKNITLNNRKADGNERLCAGDSLQLFFSEETLRKFGAPSETQDTSSAPAAVLHAAVFLRPEDIVCETADILAVNKQAGILSQKAHPSDVSLVEMIRGYLAAKGELTEASGRWYMPGVVNRLDRNTSGLVLAAKTLPAARELSEVLQRRTVRKYYYALVRGAVGSSGPVEAWLRKDEKTRQVTVLDQAFPGASCIRTAWKPVAAGGGCTLLEVHLITGRTHQIRAHLSFIGHPLAGDVKYGDEAWNAQLRRETGLRRPFLHACRVEFPDEMSYLKELRGKTIRAPLPGDLRRTLEKLGMEPPGTDCAGGRAAGSVL